MFGHGCSGAVIFAPRRHAVCVTAARSTCRHCWLSRINPDESFPPYDVIGTILPFHGRGVQRTARMTSLGRFYLFTLEGCHEQRA